MSDFWSRCLAELQRGVPQQVFQNWFSDLEADDEELESGVLVLSAPSAAKARMLHDSYGSMLSGLVTRQAGFPVDIQWKYRETPQAGEEKTKPEPVTARPESSGLQPLLTFENMVEGKANQFAYAAALQVASGAPSGGVNFNPFFIYGGVGLGKTHLMHAIGHEYLRQHPRAKVLCVTAQQYLEEFVEAMRPVKTNPEAMKSFEERYSSLDLLLVDDIQSFASRTGTQANFFQVFENLVPHGRQIVMTSDTYPRQLKDFQERLLSRLTQGLIVEIEPPELEMRIQILMQKAERIGMEMPQDCAEYIARHLRSNVRELEGAVQQVYAFVNFQHVPVSLNSVKNALRMIIKPAEAPITVENIQKTVAEYYNLKVADMHSKKRNAPIVLARQVAMYFAKELTQKSLPEIGSLFGGRDHTTVLHAVRKVKAMRSVNEKLRHDLNVLSQRIKN